MRCALILYFLPLVASAAPTAIPAPLACLERYYSIKAVERNGTFFGELPGGDVVPWEDAKERTFEEKLSHPSLKDTLSIPYHKGIIQPVTAVDEDPGRIRVDSLFSATYPTKASDLVAISFFGKQLRVHKKAVEAFSRVRARLEKAVAADRKLLPFLTSAGGTFNKRNIAGTDRPSAHSYGISLDLDPDRTEYWRWQKPASPVRWRNRTPQAIVDAFEAEGFIWGGRWYHYDTMHFEYRPELLDPRCALH